MFDAESHALRARPRWQWPYTSTLIGPRVERLAVVPPAASALARPRPPLVAIPLSCSPHHYIAATDKDRHAVRCRSHRRALAAAHCRAVRGVDGRAVRARSGASATSPAYVAHASRCRSALRRRLVVVVRAAAAASGRMGSGDHRAAACQLLNKIAMSCLSMPREASQAVSDASWGRGMRRGRWDAPAARPKGAKGAVTARYSFLVR